MEDFKSIYSSGTDMWTVPVLSMFLSEEFKALIEVTMPGTSSSTPTDDNKHNQLRVLVPMCGKTPDMVWLMERGHCVVGIEWIEDVVKSFYNDAGIAYEVHKVQIDNRPNLVGGINNGCSDCVLDQDKRVSLYKSLDGNISIYVADIFTFDGVNCLSESFDFAWDNATLTSIASASNRAQYARTVSNLLKPNGKIFQTIILDYDQKEYPSTMPFATTLNDLRDLYIPLQSTIDVIKSRDAVTIADVYKGTIINFKKLKYFAWHFCFLRKTLVTNCHAMQITESINH